MVEYRGFPSEGAGRRLIYSPDVRQASPLRRLWAYSTSSRRWIRLATTWSVLDKVFDVAPPLLIGMALSTVTAQEQSLVARWFRVVDPGDQLIVIAVLTFVIWSFESLFEYLHSVGWRNVAQSIQHEIRIDVYEHMQQLELGFFEDERTGDLLAVVNDDVNQLERFLDHGAKDVLQLITTVVIEEPPSS